MKVNFQGTAFVTGASSGIGAAYARRLASLGCDLVIVARRQGRLQNLAQELREAHGVQVTPCAVDLSLEKDIARLESDIKGISDLGMVVNNAGFSTNQPFCKTLSDRIAEMIQLHDMASTRFCRAALDPMVARNRGAIINVSSVAAFLTSSNNPIYSATKAYLNVFSESLQDEIRGKVPGIKIQCLCPGFTYTEFHDTEDYSNFDRAQIPKSLWMTAEQVVDISLNALSNRKVIVIPGLRNRLGVWIVRRKIMRAVFRKLSYRRRKRK